MKSFDQLISVRSCCNVYTNRGNDCFWLASFSCCQNKSNNWSLLSFTKRVERRSWAVIQTSKPHWVGTRDGKSAIPSAFALRQLWPSDSHKIWKKRPSSSIGSWSHFGSGMAIRSPGCSIWMKLLCDSSFRQAEPLNSVAAEQFQWSLAAPRRGALQSHSQSPPMAKNRSTFRDLQRCSHSKRHRCSRHCSSIVRQEGLDGWKR